MHRLPILMLIAGASITLTQGNAVSDVVVGEDFLYKQTTRTDTSYGEVRFALSSYGGGANGAAGVWESRWAGLGSGSIISDDVAFEPFASHHFTARFNGENTVNNDISRAYSFSDSLAEEQTLYFGGRFLATPSVGEQAQFAEFGLFTVPTTGGGDTTPGVTTTASIGIENGTFFAQAGGREEGMVSDLALGDPGSVSGDAVQDDVYYTIVGKIEFNVGAASTVADYNENGVVDAADYTVWRDHLGIDDGSATFNQGDGNGDGNVDQADYDIWSQNYGGASDRLTAYINPTSEEVSSGSTLVVEAPIGGGIRSSGTSEVFLSGGYDLAGAGSSSDAFVDDIVIGTSWDDVVSLLVPRLDAVVNPANGDVTLVNNSGVDIDLGFYEIVSESASLEVAWDSLADQGEDSGNWFENNPSESLLTESNLTSASVLLAGGGALTLAGAFDTSGSQDLIVRWGVKEGAVGLLNLANVSYAASAAAAIPEPSALGIAACLVVCGLVRRNPARAQD